MKSTTNNSKEGGSNQTKVILLIILGLISFLSLNQNHLKGYLVQESAVSYTPLITSLYNNTKSSSAIDGDNVRSALLSDKGNSIDDDEEDEVGFWSLDSSLDEEFRFWFGNQHQQQKKKDEELSADVSEDDLDIQSSHDVKQQTTKQHRQTTISKDELPIYLIQSESSSDDNTNHQTYAQISWGQLAQEWNRTAQYEHLLDVATPVSSLPMPQSTSISSTAETERRVRPIIMIHCGPKTGSTTLRKACKFNLQHTCNIPHNTAGHYPVGYMDESKLYPLIRKCTNTYHFCAKEITIPIDIPSFNNNDSSIMMIHMFPFRQYNEWAQSALKQQYDARGTNGCLKTKSLLEECKHNRMEIDFRKYGKTELSHYKTNVVERMNRLNEQHVFIVYHHRELNSVLDLLSEVYDIPMLPGSDGKGKEKRPEGTCEDSEKLLKMYHDCFSDELMKLT